MTESGNKKKKNIRWALVGYDLFVYVLAAAFYFLCSCRMTGFYAGTVLLNMFLYGAWIFASRFVAGVYLRVLRYGDVQSYIRLIFADGIAFVLVFLLSHFLPWKNPSILMLNLFITDLLAVLAMRLCYQYIYKCADRTTGWGRFLRKILRIFSFGKVDIIHSREIPKLNAAIVGAGSTGTTLADEMYQNPNSPYKVCCFIDADEEKIGRLIHDLPVFGENEVTEDFLKAKDIREIIFALPNTDKNKVKELYQKYSAFGYRAKVYDYPVMSSAENGKRVMRDFDIEDLLFRKQITMENAQTDAYYKDKVILLTGGGGSIGSELCRQLARMGPKRIIIVDIYENGAYDVQQELKIRYGSALDVRIHIVSYTNRRGLERVFRKYRPDIVINAAAHKHVPLMENDCIEAVENNVFGTLNTVELSEKYEVKRFIQVSTDKAVNPTNVMGATKRMCEFIIQAHSVSGTSTTFSATRFGNVLGSAGSVIPLFKKQIANGGPVTITDKRIIRYFMTIPEASQLVLQSGAMAKNGELFVLDMGKPVKILDLAESMIRLSGLTSGVDIEIVETGLRPGEKLYEELLIQSEQLAKTDNDLIFIEKDAPITMEQLGEKLGKLKAAAESNVEENVKMALVETVPTFKPMTISRTDVEVFEPETGSELEELQMEVVKGKKILIVDDLSLNREIAADTLAEIGMITDMAANGLDAVEKVKDNEYDFVLMDIVMPYMDGYETTRKIKELKPDLTVIAMTATTLDYNREKAFAAGMSAYIPKPLHLDELLAVMNKT